MIPADLANRFAYHPAPTPGRQEAHEDIREVCGHLADFLNQVVPEGREKDIAMTRLEETMFWSNAGIARKPEGV